VIGFVFAATGRQVAEPFVCGRFAPVLFDK